MDGGPELQAGRAEAAPVAAPLPGLSRRHLRVLLAVVLAPLAALLAVLLMLIGHEVTAPSWLRERVEVAAAGALDGGTLRFASIGVTLGSDLHARIRLVDASLRDADGRLLARVPEARATLSARGLLLRRALLVQEIVLRGAEVRVARARDGRVDLALGRAAAEPVRGDLAAGLASLPARFEGLFERPALAALRSVRIEGLVVAYDDARAGRSWTLDGGEVTLDLSEGRTSLRGEVALLSGRGEAARATLRYDSPRGSAAARIGVTLTDVAAVDIASQSPALTWLGVVDARVSVALRVALDEDGALGPLDVALKIADGQFRPAPGAPGVGFEEARAYLSYDPEARALSFRSVEVRSDWGGVSAEGMAYLRDDEGGLPRVLLGQFALSDIAVAPPGAYDAPVRFPEAEAQFRLRLDPFRVDLARLSLSDRAAGEENEDEGTRLHVSGNVAASAEGWEVALDARLPSMGRDRIMALWPEGARPALRGWFAENLIAGEMRDVAGALRIAPGSPPVVAVSGQFADVSVRPLRTHPPITGAAGRLVWEEGALALALDRGRVDAPVGGTVDLAGTTFAIPAGGGPRPAARVGLRASGPITAALSLLDVAPYRLLSAAGQPVDLASGQAEARGNVDLRLGGPMAPGELRYDIAATLRDVTTDRLVPGRTLASPSLDVAATPEGLSIAGAATLDGIEGSGTWRLPFGAASGSALEARVAVTPAALAALGVALPEGSVGGAGEADLTVDFAADEAPRFALASTLGGLSLDLPQLGWSKPAGTTGALAVEGRLGSPPLIDLIALDAPGLSAEGSIALTPDGALDRLALSRLAVGDWLDVAVTLVGRGGAAPAVEVEGGTLDLGRADFGTGGGGGPVEVALDSLRITDAIALTDLRAVLDTASGVEGTFAGFVNGGPAVTGRVAPQAGRVGARVQGDDAGAVMRAAGLFESAEGGSLDLLLLPVGPSSYEGELSVAGLRVREAPVLASLLNAISVVGLLQQLGGQGIVFDEVLAAFRIDPDRITVAQASAVGAGLGLSLDGVYDTVAGRMDFRGVVSPFYIVNGVGSLLTRRGEGLVGFNYSLQGDPAAPEVGVNPLSILTPGAFREIFRRAPPQG